ncbi:MAG: hypothetical protein JWO38_7447 [Gemmataceae bacterium]|nr:hypothetical protein [Gemmataceae bacterium]
MLGVSCLVRNTVTLTDETPNTYEERGMAEFVWIDWNLAKIDAHALSADEVEFAWHHRVDTGRWDEPESGVESYGRLP